MHRRLKREKKLQFKDCVSCLPLLSLFSPVHPSKHHSSPSTLFLILFIILQTCLRTCLSVCLEKKREEEEKVKKDKDKCCKLFP